MRMFILQLVANIPTYLLFYPNLFLRNSTERMFRTNKIMEKNRVLF